MRPTGQYYEDMQNTESGYQYTIYNCLCMEDIMEIDTLGFEEIVYLEVHNQSLDLDLQQLK